MTMKKWTIPLYRVNDSLTYWSQRAVLFKQMSWEWEIEITHIPFEDADQIWIMKEIQDHFSWELYDYEH
jgi:hypothetical protein